MKILVTGRDGQVGFELCSALASLGEVIALGRSELDLARPDIIRDVVRVIAPDVIVNAGAYTAVDRAEGEPDLAFAVNGVAPGVLGEEAQRTGALVIHYSTDYVFDGTGAGSYAETDATNPQNVYGQSKLAGEEALNNSGARSVILRTSWVFGAHGSNFIKTMLRLAGEREILRVISDQFGAPTSAGLIAGVSARIISELASNTSDPRFGLYHLAASGRTNWYEYACHVIEAARRAGLPIKVQPDAIAAIGADEYPTPAKRPGNSALDTSKLRSAFGLDLPHWTQGVDQVLVNLLKVHQ